MKKQKKNRNNLGLFVLVILLISIIVFALYKTKQSNSVPIHSPELDLSIMVPSYYEVTQKFNMISIKNKKGEITLDRYGSFYDNLDAHIKFLSEKNNVKIEILEKITSNEYQIYKVKFDKSIRTKPEDISYLILTENQAVYSLQSNSEELYTDLDAIAKSFRYNP